MKKVLPISSSKFPQKTFAVLSIIALVAFLLTLKPVAEAVKKLVEMLGITFPPLEIFQNTANTIKEVAIGLAVLLVAFAVAVISVKASLILVASSIVVYGGYRLYQTFFQGRTQNTLPEKYDMDKK